MCCLCVCGGGGGGEEGQREGSRILCFIIKLFSFCLHLLYCLVLYTISIAYVFYSPPPPSMISISSYLSHDFCFILSFYNSMISIARPVNVRR